jgi:uncharacterized phiE125 gp8 family phage protein
MTTPAYHLVETAPAGAEPLTLEETRLHLRIGHDAEDPLITGLIATARMMCEQATGLALINRGYSLWLDSWPGRESRVWWDGVREGVRSTVPQAVLLPRPPLCSVEGVYVYDAAGQAALFAPENYYTDTLRRPGRLLLLDGIAAPQPQRIANGIEIRYTAGFGMAPQAVPAMLRQGMKQLAAHMYENRGDTAERALELSGAGILFRPFRMMRLA